jgi:hypothetical protein
MRRHIGAGLHADSHAMAWLFHLMKVVVMPATRAASRFLGQLRKQRLIKKAGH